MRKRSGFEVFCLFITWLFSVQSAIWILLALSFGISTAIFIHRSVVTSAQITDLVDHRDDDGGVTLCLQFVFDAKDGFRYRHTSGSCSTPAGFDIGQQVRIRYVPSDPAKAYIDTFWQTWALCAAFGIAAVITGLIGAAGLLLIRRRGWEILFWRRSASAGSEV
jgi:cytochrome bd-type quinol oxidase subunit 1